MLLNLQKDIVYGPVSSRRLGVSLGINILPPDKKLCPFNCVYCQYGWTKEYNPKEKHLDRFPSVQSIVKTLKKALSRLPYPPSYITFSGNGEPTLHPDFDRIVEKVIFLRNQLAPEAKTAILSNSAFVSDRQTRKTLSKLDVRIMKLDCGSAEIFYRYNQPCQNISLDKITKGLRRLPEVTIQTLFCSGKSGNLDSKNIAEWIKRLQRINPLHVQVYTLDRGHPSRDIIPAGKDELKRIKAQVQKEGISVEIY